MARMISGSLGDLGDPGALHLSAWTAGGRDKPFDLHRAYHPYMVADVDLVVGPVKMGLGNVGLRPQDSLDVVCALRAVHFFHPEGPLLYAVVAALMSIAVLIIVIMSAVIIV
jgi:hypothetical protein